MLLQSTSLCVQRVKVREFIHYSNKSRNSGGHERKQSGQLSETPNPQNVPAVDSASNVTTIAEENQTNVSSVPMPGSGSGVNVSSLTQ